MAASMLPDFCVISIKSKEWIYRGEGNKSLVIAVPKERKVLRFTKESQVDANNQVCPEFGLEIQMQLAYFQHVLKPLLGKRFILKAELIRLPSDEVNELNSKLKSLRSEFRKSKRLPVNDCCGLYLPDCTLLPEVYCKYEVVGHTIAVELKPKMGFLPTSALIPENQKLKKEVCRFQLMQRKKMRDNRIKKMSGYCPVDLFSGCPVRMKRAITALIENPQNNLAIFKDGERMYGEGKDCDLSQLLSDVFRPASHSSSCAQNINHVDNLLEILIKTLLSVPSEDASSPEYHQSQTCRCSNSDGSFIEQLPHSDGLVKDCVLGNVLSVQKLDTMDVEGIKPLFHEIMDNKSSLPEEKLQHWLYGGLDESVEADIVWKDLKPSLQQAIWKVREFLMAATMKDCSIMIAFQKLSDRSYTTVTKDLVVTDLHGVKFLFSIALLDLDMKPVERIPKYLQNERDLVSLYRSDIT